MLFKIIAWALFIYLIFRFVGYLFAPSGHSNETRKRGSTVLHQDKRGGTKVTAKDADEGEYIDYKEIK